MSSSRRSCLAVTICVIIVAIAAVPSTHAQSTYCYEHTSCRSCTGASSFCVWCRTTNECSSGAYSCDISKTAYWESDCPPEAWAMAIMIPIIPAFLIGMWICISYTTTKPPASEIRTEGPCKCNHAQHHLGTMCTVQIPNVHQTCMCASTCGADFPQASAFELQHCGRVCGRQYTIKRGKHWYTIACSCGVCTCARCAPAVICGCNSCQCPACIYRPYEQTRDNKFCCVRIPLAPVGFAIMIYGSVVGWTFGAIWGAIVFIPISCGARRWAGYCGRPKAVVGQSTVCCGSNLAIDKWAAWDKRDRLAQGFVNRGQGGVPMGSPGAPSGVFLATHVVNPHHQVAPFTPQPIHVAPPHSLLAMPMGTVVSSPVAPPATFNASDVFCQGCGRQRTDTTTVFCGGCGRRFGGDAVMTVNLGPSEPIFGSSSSSSSYAPVNKSAAPLPMPTPNPAVLMMGAVNQSGEGLPAAPPPAYSA